jgi:hypothetical protein
VFKWIAPALLIAALPLPAAAEWQIKPFAGVTFGGSTSFVDLEKAAGTANVVWGVSGALIGEVLGVEGDFAHAPGFFESGNQAAVTTSSVTTWTGNIMFAMPRSMFRYTLRPYVLAGIGIIHAHEEHQFGTLPVASTLPALDVGGGATGFVTDRFGWSWELRHFRSFKGRQQFNGVSFNDEQLSFWRASMSAVIRY